MFKYSPVLTLALAALGAQAADDYKLGPDSQFKAEVPHGRIERFQFTNSTVFPGTVRDGGVYIPAQYDSSKPAALMVFQDGMGYLSTNGGSGGECGVCCHQGRGGLVFTEGGARVGGAGVFIFFLGGFAWGGAGRGVFTPGGFHFLRPGGVGCFSGGVCFPGTQGPPASRRSCS